MTKGTGPITCTINNARICQSQLSATQGKTTEFCHRPLRAIEKFDDAMKAVELYRNLMLYVVGLAKADSIKHSRGPIEHGDPVVLYHQTALIASDVFDIKMASRRIEALRKVVPDGDISVESTNELIGQANKQNSLVGTAKLTELLVFGHVATFPFAIRVTIE